ncbi:MAG: hypothetical protein JRI57_09630 [Deltaproteobacteria bacterium]|nr:hypothetical protein [Deltaproteobacteria bacterium]MBW1952251.1 hypothetical protein [Deltaproteobacteria bacterium]MBW1986037.1 hypothetical protein [Deltaproteobacteria bacterium]
MHKDLVLRGSPIIMSRVLAGLTFLFFLFNATPGWSHRVLIYAWPEGNTIHTESKFVPGGAVRNGEVKVLDNKTDQLLVTGKTDAQGKFSFAIPPQALAQKMDLRIVLEAAMGHKAEWLLKAQNYLPGTGDSKPSAAPAGPSTDSQVAAPSGSSPAPLDRQTLEQIVDQALDRKLAPIMEMLAQSQTHKPSLPEIIGGIGYILGIWGVAAYFKSKRNKAS